MGIVIMVYNTYNNIIIIHTDFHLLTLGYGQPQDVFKKDLMVFICDSFEKYLRS